MPSRVRKPIDKLRLSDLDAFPIWEFAIDEEGVEGQDETWVRPVERDSVPLYDSGLPVSAEFKLANGTVARGIIVIDTPYKIQGGVIISTDKYLVIPDSFSSNMERFMDALGLSLEDVFPIAYRLKVKIEGESELRSGLIELTEVV